EGTSLLWQEDIISEGVEGDSVCLHRDFRVLERLFARSSVKVSSVMMTLPCLLDVASSQKLLARPQRDVYFKQQSNTLKTQVYGQERHEVESGIPSLSCQANPFLSSHQNGSVSWLQR
ncbi:mCG146108, partial [Mus musculus]